MTTPPGLTCATCHQPLARALARRTEEGWVHADDLGCTATGMRLAGASLPEVVARLYVDGASISELEAALGISNRQVRRHLAETNTPRRPPLRWQREPQFSDEDLAYDGGWVRRGLIWTPTPRKDVA